MALTVRNVRFNSDNSLKFLARRIVRLTPPYYFAILFALITFAFKAQLLGEPISLPSSSALFQHALFLQEFFQSPAINSVFWTLCIEIQFYLAFAALIYVADTSSQSISRYALFSLLAIVALAWPTQLTTTSIWPGGFIGFWYSFLCGVLACWASQQKGALLAFSAIYSIGVLAIGVVLGDNFAIATGITSGLLIMASHYEMMGKWLNWKWLQWLGIISYSLYLLHNPVTGASFRVVNKLINADTLLNNIIGMLACLFTSLTVAYIAYLVIEKPSIKMSHYFKTK